MSDQKVTPREFADKIFTASDFDVLQAFVHLNGLFDSMNKDYFDAACRELLMMHIQQVGDMDHRRMVLVLRRKLGD